MLRAVRSLQAQDGDALVGMAEGGFEMGPFLLAHIFGPFFLFLPWICFIWKEFVGYFPMVSLPCWLHVLVRAKSFLSLDKSPLYSTTVNAKPAVTTRDPRKYLLG